MRSHAWFSLLADMGRVGAQGASTMAPWADHEIHEDDLVERFDENGEDDVYGGSEQDESEYADGDDAGEYTGDDEEALPLSRAPRVTQSTEDWGNRGNRFKDLTALTKTLSSGQPLRPTGVMAKRLSAPPRRASSSSRAPVQQPSAPPQQSPRRRPPPAAGSAPLPVSTRPRERTSSKAPAPVVAPATVRETQGEYLLSEALQHYAKVELNVIDAFIEAFGGADCDPRDIRVKEMDDLTAKGLAPHVRTLAVGATRVPTLVQGRL